MKFRRLQVAHDVILRIQEQFSRQAVQGNKDLLVRTVDLDNFSGYPIPGFYNNGNLQPVRILGMLYKMEG